jgi:TfoX/Sxy family transcriptional regulator of competence genes
MAWKKVPPQLVEFLDNALTSFDSERRTMFGCPVYFVKDNMFAGAHEDKVLLRLPQADQADLFAAHEQAVPFEPMGRRMREYVLLPDSLYGNEAVFEKWLKRSFEYVSSLPPKERKKKKTWGA